MKDFDLEAAKRGAAVCMRSGKAIEIITLNGRNDKFPILAYAGSSARVMSFSEKGRYRLKYASNEDLMMRDDDYLERLERGEYGRTLNSDVIKNDLRQLEFDIKNLVEKFIEKHRMYPYGDIDIDKKPFISDVVVKLSLRE